MGGEHLLGHRLVHRQRRAEHAAADVGTSASSSIPCTVPSSPSGPCSSGSTTVTLVVGGRVGEHRRRRHGRCRSGRAGRAARRARPPARRWPASASAHSPSVEMPTGVIRYRAGSTAASTWAAVTQLTSCSADWPPNSTTRWMRSSATSPHRPRPVAPSASVRRGIGRTVPFGREDPGIRRGRGDRRPAGRARRRRRRGVVRLPRSSARPAVRADRRRARRPRLHRRRRVAAGAGAYLTARARRLGVATRRSWSPTRRRR